MVAAFGREDFFLTARAFLVVETYCKLLERVDIRDFGASMLCWTSSLATARPASSASVMLTSRAERQTYSFLPEKFTTDVAADFVPMLTVQARLHLHSILQLFPPPRVPEAVIEQVPECPDIQLFSAPHWRVLVFMLKRIVEKRFDEFLGAFVTNPRVAYPPRIGFKLVIQAERAVEEPSRHGVGVVGLYVSAIGGREAVVLVDVVM